MYVLRYYSRGLLIALLIYFCTRFPYLEDIGNWICSFYLLCGLILWLVDAFLNQDYSDEDVLMVLTEEWKEFERVQKEIFHHKRLASCKKATRLPSDYWLICVLERFKSERVVECRLINKSRGRWDCENEEYRLSNDGIRRKNKHYEELREKPPLHGYINPVPAG